MGFGEALQSVFGKYATFSGRARRSEYWYFFLFNVIINIVLNTIYAATNSTVFTVLIGAYSLVALVPGLTVSWRRLHDTGRSGAYYLFILIPLVGAIILLVWVCKDSQPGINQYGPNPKEM